MARFLVLALAVFALIWLLRRSFAEPPEKTETRGGNRPRAASEGELVRCEHCGLHLPRGEALERDGRRYCCEEHARLGPKGGR